MPVVCQGRCIAASKLVCPPEESEARFAHLVGVLDVLVRDFAATEGDALQDFGWENPSTESDSIPFTGTPSSIVGIPGHALIRQAIRYVEENLSDPHLTVRRIAEELEVSPNYLSQLFSNQVGGRLGRLIVEQRVKRAQKLLASTDWQIKRVAEKTGYANANWFSHVFHAHTGFTPNEYRARAQLSIA